MQDIEQLGGELLAAVAASASAEALEAARVAALGRKGALTAALKDLQSLDADARKSRAQALNQLKDRVTDAIAARKAEIDAGALDARLKAERLDVTLPARPAPEGRIHPVSQVMDELVEIFAAMGFRVAEGPDIEDDFHNFTALNMPPDHPARQDFDTFYLRQQAGGAGERKLLRTHTSPVQIRTMRAARPPHRIIVPGRTYRRDSDQTHTPMFHQIEGLVIDRDVHMGHLKGVLHEFCAAFFEVKNLRMRFRPSYFPFTEPSAEVDIGCTRKGGEIRVGAGDDWLEILGCGMVNRRVLEHCGVDANEWQGFAWGLGIDRMAMLKYGIPDLRAFFDGDLPWLRHYGFLPLDVPALGQGLSR